MLALAGSHAQGRVAFQQLGAVESLLDAVPDVVQLNVLVEVHEILAPRVGNDRVGMAEGRSPPLGRRRCFGRGFSQVCRRLPAGAAAVLELVPQGINPVDPAGGKDPRRQPVREVLFQRLRVPHAGSRLAEDAVRGSPSHAHGDAVTGDGLGLFRQGISASVQRAEQRPSDGLLARRRQGFIDGSARTYGDPAPPPLPLSRLTSPLAAAGRRPAPPSPPPGGGRPPPGIRRCWPSPPPLAGRA